MAGALCPNCGQYTFYKTNTGRKCSRCNYIMEVPVQSGQGRRCSNCGKNTVFDNVCNNCGAKYSIEKDS